MLKIQYKNNNKRVCTRIFLKENAEGRFGMILKNFDDVVLCLQGYPAMYYVDAYYIREAVIESARDVINNKRKYFQNINDLINHINKYYI